MNLPASASLVNVYPLPETVQDKVVAVLETKLPEINEPAVTGLPESSFSILEARWKV